MELQDLVPVLQAVIRSGNALPNELIYAVISTHKTRCEIISKKVI